MGVFASILWPSILPSPATKQPLQARPTVMASVASEREQRQNNTIEDKPTVVPHDDPCATMLLHTEPFSLSP